jgi:peptide deformylase
MAKALDKELEGVALAAPQIGIPYRIFVVRKDRTILPPKVEDGAAPPPPPPPEIEVYINPEIIKRSQRRTEMDEGCLSVRGVYGITKRYEKITVRAQRVDGSTFQRGGSGLLAQIFQHETDHLNGVLFVEHAKNLIKVTHPNEPVA